MRDCEKPTWQTVSHSLCILDFCHLDFICFQHFPHYRFRLMLFLTEMLSQTGGIDYEWMHIWVTQALLCMSRMAVSMFAPCLSLIFKLKSNHCEADYKRKLQDSGDTNFS